MQIAVGLRAPLRVFRASLNLLQTKTGTDGFFRPLAGQNTHTQVPFEFLRHPHFRIYIAGLPDQVADELAERLRTGRTAYTVALGLAPCLADVTWVGEWSAQPLANPEWQVTTAVPLRDGIQVHYEDSRRYHRLRIPVTMDGSRIVHRHQEIVLAEDGQPIRGQGGTGVLHAIGPDSVAFL